MSKRIIILLIAVIFVAVMIFYFSSQNGPNSNQTSARFVDIIIKLFVPGYDSRSEKDQHEIIRIVNIAVRKLAHFTEFALFGALLALLIEAIKGKNQKNGYKAVGIITVFIGFIYAVSDEIHQLFTGRTSKFTDVLIDTAGVLFGVFIIWLLRRVFRGGKIKSRVYKYINKMNA